MKSKRKKVTAKKFLPDQVFLGSRVLGVHVSGALQMKQEPLITAMKKAYWRTQTRKVDLLSEELSRWKRKQTIARNKIMRLQDQLTALCYALAGELDGVKPETKPTSKGQQNESGIHTEKLQP